MGKIRAGQKDDLPRQGSADDPAAEAMDSAGADAATMDARRVLYPPLRFAARDDFAHVARLRGFGSLVRTTAARLTSIPVELSRLLEPFDDDFDQRDEVDRAAMLKPLWDFFAETSSAAPATDLHSPSQFDTSATINSLAPGAKVPRSAAPVRKARVAKVVAEVRAPAREGAPIRDLMLEPCTTLPGVGPARAAALEQRDLGTIGALLYTLPRAYEDRRSVRPLGDCEVGFTSVVQGEIIAAGAVGRGRGGRYEVTIVDDTGRLRLVFFRFKLFDMNRRFPLGGMITAVGEIARHAGGVQMVHPIVVRGERTAEMSGIWPVYPEIRGLHPTDLARAVRSAVRRLEIRPVVDLVPRAILDQAGLPEINTALLAIHAPDDDISDENLSRLSNRRTRPHLRLAFDEVFVLQLALGLKRRRGAQDRALTIAATDGKALAKELLPFVPTGAQSRSTAETLADLARPSPMGRLLQGDVGAGKTAVAAIGALAAIRAGMQVAIMAPTEILAEQHHATFQRWFSPLGIRVDLLTGSGKTKARRLKLAKLKHKEIQLLVGTHALLSDDVQFGRLGFCIIDEQHRFGVVQRLALSKKGPRDDDGEQILPHVLVMTATPIPRSLALTVYGDLAVSVIDELPPGRSPVKTKLLRKSGEQKAWAAIEALLARGERAYVVFPLIEESEKLDLANATQGYEDMAARFGEEQVALLHGRIARDEREDIMARFTRGEISVLVSTTVIEVGVDVPEATCMIIQNAERFGLSQLHQLRGRVGRSDRASLCFLIVGDDGAGKDGYRRLKIMEESNDGFRIAEEDLVIRGPGDFLGTRQHGLPTFAFADLTRHAVMIEKARSLAQGVLDHDPDLELPAHTDLRALVFERFRDRLALAVAG